MKVVIRIFLECVSGVVIVILVAMTMGLAEQRKSLQAKANSLSAAYQEHLVGEYEKTICEVRPPTDRNSMPTDKERYCVAGITGKAKAEVEAAAKR